MLELSAFVGARKSGKNPKPILLPIFYMISPNELKYITKDNSKWKELEDSEVRRGEWQNALKEARSINGFTFEENKDEGHFRDEIVTEIGGILRRIKPPMLLEFKPVGIEKQVLEVEELLDMKGTESALAVIVYGFGGVGKSILAAAVVESFDWSSMDCRFCRVAIDEKTADKTSHIINLQKRILQVLERAEVDVGDTLEGRNKIKQALENKCCLLFIDNVVDNVYIKDLLPPNLFPAQQKTKLRVIITSRENNLKAELQITWKEYEVKGLSDTASQELLVEKIVPRQVVENIYSFEEEERMIKEVAAGCRGVPLLLSVFGKHLSVERNKDSYEEALNVLREGNLDSYRDEDLGTRLMFVYNKIKDKEVKEAFLDICIYFHGWEWNLVMDIVDYSKIEDLRRRALVSKSSSGEVIIHDILRFMGMKEARLTRFSNYQELSDALEKNLVVFENVKGISLLKDGPQLITIKSTQLEAMYKSLRVLMLGSWVTLDGPPCHRAFENLRYLRVGDITAFPFEDPSKLGKLRVLVNGSKSGMNLSRLPSSLKRISQEVPHMECDKFVELPFQNLTSLKSFIVKTSLKSFSHEIGKSVELRGKLHLPSSLVDLDLNGCKNLPKDIGHLIAVESLILDRSDMEYLPQGFVKLKKLKHLSMDYCSRLVFLSEELGKLSSLEFLSMKGCRNLRALPESLGELRTQSLNLHALFFLNKLPNSFGKMPLLKDVSLESCHSLMSLPGSFAQLKMLETLKIINCTKLSYLPKNFGQLRRLREMRVSGCDLLETLPRGFGTLTALKTLALGCCISFVNLPKGFTELTSLEELSLYKLPLMSRIPDGFEKLQKLRSLTVNYCEQLETLPDHFENMTTLERLSIRCCPELDGAIMEKIVKLGNCYMVDIYGSRKLSEKWKHMQAKAEHLIAVSSERDRAEEERRAAGLALLHGKCVELDNATAQLIERSSLLEKGTTATLALIMLPPHVQSQETLQGFVDMAEEIAKTNESGKLQIVCARKVDLEGERLTPTKEEERAEEEVIRQILLSLPEGSCVIPSFECKRLKILTWCCGEQDSFLQGQFQLFMGNVGVDMELTAWADISSKPEIHCKPEIEARNKTPEIDYLRSRVPLGRLMEARNKMPEIDCLRSWVPVGRFMDVGNKMPEIDYQARNKTRVLVKELKGKGIHYLLNDHNTSKVMVDDLHGKVIGLIKCDPKYLECIKLQQIYKDLQHKDSNFIWIWIPPIWLEDCGHGSYTRLIQWMPWATFPHPCPVDFQGRDFGFHLINDQFQSRYTDCYITLLDTDGQITNHDALPLLLAWGVKAYPFTQHTIPESFSMVASESCLEFLLHGMNIVGRKPMKSKMTFLYADHPLRGLEMKSKIEELTQIHGSFEVLYVGKFDEWQISKIENFKQSYEAATQNMSWPSLSFSDMITFWYRFMYLGKQSNWKTLHRPAKDVYGPWDRRVRLVLMDGDGLVTRVGEDVVQMICESSDGEGMAMRVVKDELMKSLSRGKCSPIVRTFFRDEIHNHPRHPQHSLSLSWIHFEEGEWCGVCWVRLLGGNRSYVCKPCKWYICGSCWMKHAKQTVMK